METEKPASTGFENFSEDHNEKIKKETEEELLENLLKALEELRRIKHKSNEPKSPPELIKTT